MARWSAEQDRILMENGSLGAEKVRDLIERRTGVYRTVGATQRHASRIGVLLAVRGVCPMCGAVAVLNKRTGFCKLCHAKDLLEKSRHANDVLRQIRANDNPKEEKAYRREYDAERQRNSRERRKAS